jgi:hypothetical protein
LKRGSSQALVAHTYNPTYLGCRNQEDLGLKPSWANSSARSYLENTHHKKGLVEWYHKKKKRKI